MNVDPQSNKYDQLFNLKGLIRPPLPSPPQKKKKIDPCQSPRKKQIFCKVLIIQFNTYLNFGACLLLYLTISKVFHLTKCELAKVYSEPSQTLWVLGNPFSTYPKISERLILRIIIPEILNLTKILVTKIQSDSSKMVKVGSLENDTICC